jgi:hypothetical protein
MGTSLKLCLFSDPVKMSTLKNGFTVHLEGVFGKGEQVMYYILQQLYIPDLFKCARYHQARKQRHLVQPKSNREFGIGVHFRWGDTHSSNVEKPRERTGTSLKEFSLAAQHWRRSEQQKSGAIIKVHFFSEGSPGLFAEFKQYNPDVIFHLGGSWKTTIDTISQCDVLLGGQSSFFVAGAALCTRCSVWTYEPKFWFNIMHTNKFVVHPEEARAGSSRHITAKFILVSE